MNSKLLNKVLSVFLLLILGGLIVFGIVHYETKKEDLQAEPVIHTGCTIVEKYDKKLVRGRAHEPAHFIDSSCGLFRTSEDIANSLEAGKNYDLSATAGNWANKPTIVSFTEAP